MKIQHDSQSCIGVLHATCITRSNSTRFSTVLKWLRSLAFTHAARIFGREIQHVAHSHVIFERSTIGDLHNMNQTECTINPSCSNIMFTPRTPRIRFDLTRPEEDETDGLEGTTLLSRRKREREEKNLK